ncbi:MAG: hypothetical protein L0387_46430 [Acidobacteria bacterium]|nr:hypothetical protein [Acidobacteriota bacterium]
MDYRANWTYASFPSERREHLTSDCPSNCEIIRQIGEAMKDANIRFAIDPGHFIPVDDALRPLFYVDLDEDLVDWFFNGVGGYRAQYYKSPENGLRANAYAFAKLKPILFAAANRENFTHQHPRKGQLSMSETEFLDSLRLPSAKIWGDESRGELRGLFDPDKDSGPDIDALRWLENASAGHDKARKCTKAPRFSTLKFHGAFLKDGGEVIPLDKMARSEDIYLCGFS